MRVWIDADACPRLARDQVVKFALKRGFEVVLVAGQAVARPNFACVRLIVVPSGPDAADDHLVEHAEPGDLVVIYQSGAYGFTASPQGFLSHPACVEVLV